MSPPMRVSSTKTAALLVILSVTIILAIYGALVRVIRDQSQELEELRQICGCRGALEL